MRSRTSDGVVTKKLHREAKALLHKTVAASRRSLGAEHPGNLASVKSTCPSNSPPETIHGQSTYGNHRTGAAVKTTRALRALAAEWTFGWKTRCGKVSRDSAQAGCREMIQSRDVTARGRRTRRPQQMSSHSRWLSTQQPNARLNNSAHLALKGCYYCKGISQGIRI